jgi:hypothetical protein
MAERTTPIEKGASPFYPDQPVPVEFFVGRQPQIDHIMTQGAGQVAHGKPVTIYIQGDYAIGKSSLASYILEATEKEFDLHGIYVPLGGTNTMEDVAQRILEATIRSGLENVAKGKTIFHWLSRYISKVQLFNVTFNTDELRKEVPNLASTLGMLGFLAEAHNRLQETGTKGICLILDEINGITSNTDFAHFVKGVVDTNAVAPIVPRQPVPLLLILCGVEQRRRDMIERLPPVGRVFDVVEVERMTTEEVRQFYLRAFNSVNMTIEQPAMRSLVSFSSGHPKIMQLIGNRVFWIDTDRTVDQADVMASFAPAIDEFGKKYVEHQVYQALQSMDYRAILVKISGSTDMTGRFRRAEIIPGLTDSEKRKLDNLIQRLKDLNVIHSPVRGEYSFADPMVRLYIYLTHWELNGPSRLGGSAEFE